MPSNSEMSTRERARTSSAAMSRSTILDDATNVDFECLGKKCLDISARLEELSERIRQSRQWETIPSAIVAVGRDVGTLWTTYKTMTEDERAVIDYWSIGSTPEVLRLTLFDLITGYQWQCARRNHHCALPAGMQAQTAGKLFSERCKQSETRSLGTALNSLFTQLKREQLTADPKHQAGYEAMESDVGDLISAHRQRCRERHQADCLSREVRDTCRGRLPKRLPGAQSSQDGVDTRQVTVAEPTVTADD